MQTSDEHPAQEQTSSLQRIGTDLRDRLPQILLLAVLVIAASLRLTGLNWDEGTHLHPDERFLSMVETSIQIPASLGEYFNTDISPFNPHNVGHGFFVYGTLPIFIVRYVGEWVGKTGYGEIHLVGRALSTTFDLISILLIYLIGTRLYRRRVALLASFFVALSVLLIQHAHFFVVDSIANAFILAGFYFAIRVLDEGEFYDYLLFGLALGMSVASKINAAPLAGVVALAGLARICQATPEARKRELYRVSLYLIAAALVSLLMFRIVQPYAFSGPSFFDIKFNPKWLANLEEILNQNQGNSDAPFVLQWANRLPVLHSLQNMLLWGMGLPLGVLAWAGWIWAVLELIRGVKIRHLLPVVWIGAYFLWQSISFTPAMRYQMPIYPPLALMAAWGLWHAWERAGLVRVKWRKLARVAVAVVGVGSILGTAFWALAFTSIYRETFTRVAASRWIYSHIPGVINLVVETDSGEELLESIPMPQDFSLSSDTPYVTSFSIYLDGVAKAVLIPYAQSLQSESAEITLTLSLLEDPNAEPVLATAIFDGHLSAGEEQRLELELSQPVQLQPDQNLHLRLELIKGGPVVMRGSAIIHETTWDDGMPWSVDGRSMNGRYIGLNQELYWPDDQDDEENGISDKLERIAETLTQGEYLIISSSRQYGSIPRVLIRYPLTAAYYRALFGCPEPHDIEHCAAVAKPGEIQGDLGYELIKIFQSNPRLGPIEINDQGSEETFTVYDHPKVLVFKKSDDFSDQRVSQLLEKVDISRVVHVLPRDVGSMEIPTDLMLPADRWEAQQTSGTWSDLFNRNSLINRSPVVGVVVWWIVIGLVGLLAFPITRVAFPGFVDGGYPLARVVGLLLVAWGSWVLGSIGVPVTAMTIFIVLLAMAAFSLTIAWRDREELVAYLQDHWREILWTEILALSFFLFDLLIRIGNPDLWHPAKGGEKPMDFSYLNAVIKSRTFPPYDPWFAGGYINYYYFGFVIIGMPIKLLGIVPTVAYNLVIPTLFSLLALVAYSVCYNLVAWFRKSMGSLRRPNPRLAGSAAAVALVVLGNLGTARMFYDGLKRIGAPSGTEPASALVGIGQAMRGLGRYLTLEQQMLYPLDQWYWNPSRAIPPGPGEAGPITEFPFFTFLYADLHAHMISRPLTVLAIGWGLSWLLAAARKRRWRWFDLGLSLFIGGLVFGSIGPTNIADYPVYWVIGVIAVIYAVWLRHRRIDPWTVIEAGLMALILIGLARYLYQPFHRWYGQGWGALEIWNGSRTPLDAYFTVHGLFLFVAVSWMIWETRTWMAVTPLSALQRLRPAFGAIAVGAVGFVALIAVLAGQGIVVSIVAIPLMVWAGVLLLRPGLAVEKRLVLTLIGIAVALTFLVELVVVKGTISRMNTVFKFYLQVWDMFSLAAGGALAWIVADLPSWRLEWRRGWILALGLLVFSAALYPLAATPAKIRDRMANEAPRTLDGMAFMPFVDNYYDLGQKLKFDEDYRAIRWMQDNIQGSPVIIEANTPEYRWGNRFTIYTGLPGVIGWLNHQRQQRVTGPPGMVEERARDILDFYLTRSVEEASEILDRYGVQYVILGRLERIFYEQVHPCLPSADGQSVTCDLRGWPWGMPTPDVSPAECELVDPDSTEGSLVCPTHGLEKFDAMAETGLLREIYRDGETVIYEVVQ